MAPKQDQPKNSVSFPLTFYKKHIARRQARIAGSKKQVETDAETKKQDLAYC